MTLVCWMLVYLLSTQFVQTKPLWWPQNRVKRSSPCGPRVLPTVTDSGLLSSPQLLNIGDYPPNLDCVWQLSTFVPSKICLSFLHFDLEDSLDCLADYLLVVDEEGTELLRGCGARISVFKLQTRTSHLRIVFHTDAYVERRGFVIKYEPCAEFDNTEQEHYMAADDQSQTVVSPNYPAVYNVNETIRWFITTNITKNIDYTFTDTFGIEYDDDCLKDSVSLYDANSYIIGRYCGTELPPSGRTSTNNLLVIFTSDASGTAPGFKLSFSTVDSMANKMCEHEFRGTDTAQFISSPGFPNRNYPDLINCTWNVQAPNGTRLSFMFFEDLFMEDSPGCSSDNLTFYEGSSEKATLIRTVCGHQPSDIYNETLLPLETNLFIHFATDATFNDLGFRVAVVAVAYCNLTAEYYTSSDWTTVTSPFYPNHYGRNMYCSRKFYTAPEMVFEYYFDKVFHIEDSIHCRNDHLNIWIRDKQEGRFCGSLAPVRRLTNSSYLSIQFITDSTLQSTGYKMYIRTVLKDELLPCRNHSSNCSSQYHCGVPSVWPNFSNVDDVTSMWRIAGGDEAVAHSWPWIVALTRPDRDFIFCGGALISDLWVLTSAYCVANTNVHTDEIDLVIGIGWHILLDPSTSRETVKVRQIIAHQNFSGVTMDNDIALIRLVNPVTFTDKIRPVCLPKRGPTLLHEGLITAILGWGLQKSPGSPTIRSSELSSFPITLQQALIHVTNTASCRAVLADQTDRTVTENMFCAGGTRNAPGFCESDTGGPALTLVDDHFVLIGVASWTVGCSTTRSPGVFTRVDLYLDWIADISGLASDISSTQPDIITNPVTELSSTQPDTTNPVAQLSSTQPDTTNPVTELSSTQPDTTNPVAQLSSTQPDTTNSVTELTGTQTNPVTELTSTQPDTTNPVTEITGTQSATTNPVAEYSSTQPDTTNTIAELSSTQQDAANPFTEATGREPPFSSTYTQSTTPPPTTPLPTTPWLDASSSWAAPSRDKQENTVCSNDIVRFQATSRVQYVQSENYPAAYPNEARDCQCILKAPAGWGVTIEIGDDFFLSGNCTTNYVHFIAVEDGEPRDLFRACGVLSQGAVVRTAADNIYVLYQVHDNHDNATGFRFAYYTNRDKRTLGQEIRTELGRTTALCPLTNIPLSVGIPGRISYNGGSSCGWIFFSAYESKNLLFTISHTNFNRNQNDCLDKLEIRWGRNSSKEFNRIICDTITDTAADVILDARYLAVFFYRETTWYPSQFEILVSLIGTEEHYPACPGPLILNCEDGDQTLLSPGYPLLLVIDQQCSWRLDAKPSHLIDVSFGVFSANGLNIYDGPSTSAPSVRLTVVPPRTVPTNVTSVGSQLYIVCLPNQDCASFTFVYRQIVAVSKPCPTEISLPLNSSIGRDSKRYRLDSLTSGHVFSLLLPLDYKPTTGLGWRFYAATNDQVLEIFIKSLDFGTFTCESDSLSIFDGVSGPLLVRLCTMPDALTLLTSGSSAEVNFFVGPFRNVKTFQLQIRSLDGSCGLESYRCFGDGRCTTNALCNGVDDCPLADDESVVDCSWGNLCGVPKTWPVLRGPARKNRIVGGVEAVPNSWPWIASLQYGGKHFCGGTLIALDWVLTAGHCLTERTPNDKAFVKVVLGWHDLSLQYVTGLVVAADYWVIHESYDPVLLDNDIALIKLATPVPQFTDTIRRLCLPSSAHALTPLVRAGTDVVVVGWGALHEEDQKMPSRLQQVVLQVTATAECVAAYRPGEITDNMFCAGKRQGQSDSCQGDSGGPIVRQLGGRYVQIGIVSWGNGCARAGQPGVYTLLEKYVTWVDDVMKHTSKP